MSTITDNISQRLDYTVNSDQGFYSKATAARLTRVPISVLRRWDKIGIVSPKTLWTNEQGKESYGYTFEGLVYLRLIRMLREMKPPFSMRKVVDTVSYLVDMYGIPGPRWVDARIVSDGRELWVRQPVTAAASRSGQMPLARFVYFDREFEVFARRADAVLIPWSFMRWVEIRPTLRNGMPVIKNTGIETAIIHAAFRQGLTAGDVRSYYPFLTIPQIRHSEEFELSLDEPIEIAA